MVTPPFLEVQWVDMHNGERVRETYGDAYEKKRNCHAGKSSNQLLVFSTLYNYRSHHSQKESNKCVTNHTVHPA